MGVRSSGHTSKSNPDKLRVSVTRGKEPNKKVTWGDKKQPFDAKKMVTDLSPKQFQQVSKWVHNVNTISGSSAKTEAESDTEGAISEAESEASTPKPKKPKEARASSQLLRRRRRPGRRFRL